MDNGANAAGRRTLIEEGTTFKGTLTSSCPIDVRGRIEGEIETPALTVSENGAVHGRAKVGQVHSDGELSGEFEAESIELAGSVKDNTVIRARSLEVKLSANRGRLQVIFGECELSIGDEPTEHDFVKEPDALEELDAADVAAPMLDPMPAPSPAPMMTAPEMGEVNATMARDEAATEVMSAMAGAGAQESAEESPAAAASHADSEDESEDDDAEGETAELNASEGSERQEGKKGKKRRKNRGENGSSERSGWSHPPSHPPSQPPHGS